MPKRLYFVLKPSHIKGHYYVDNPFDKQPFKPRNLLGRVDMPQSCGQQPYSGLGRIEQLISDPYTPKTHTMNAFTQPYARKPDLQSFVDQAQLYKDNEQFEKQYEDMTEKHLREAQEYNEKVKQELARLRYQIDVDRKYADLSQKHATQEGGPSSIVPPAENEHLIDYQPVDVDRLVASATGRGVQQNKQQETPVSPQPNPESDVQRFIREVTQPRPQKQYVADMYTEFTQQLLQLQQNQNQSELLSQKAHFATILQNERQKLIDADFDQQSAVQALLRRIQELEEGAPPRPPVARPQVAPQTVMQNGNYQAHLNNMGAQMAEQYRSVPQHDSVPSESYTGGSDEATPADSPFKSVPITTLRTPAQQKVGAGVDGQVPMQAHPEREIDLLKVGDVSLSRISVNTSHTAATTAAKQHAQPRGADPLLQQLIEASKDRGSSYQRESTERDVHRLQADMQQQLQRQQRNNPSQNILPSKKPQGEQQSSINIDLETPQAPLQQVQLQQKREQSIMIDLEGDNPSFQNYTKPPQPQPQPRTRERKKKKKAVGPMDLAKKNEGEQSLNIEL